MAETRAWGMQREAALVGRRRLRRDKIVARVLAYVGVIVMAVPFFFPFAWLVSTSFKTASQIFVFPPNWIPNPVAWSNYPNVLTYIPFMTYLWNTMQVCFWNVLGTLISCSLAAYALARLRFPGRTASFAIVLSTMMLPYPVTVIPLYILFKNLGWVGTFYPLTVPAFFGNAFFIFLLRQFFMTIPLELSEAAKVDGASEFRIYAQIILPLSKPALATTALFTFLWTYTDFLNPLIYLTDNSTYTLSLGLNGFLGAHSAEWALLMAASVLFTLPIIILYFFAQKTFIQGIQTTGLKG
jgi:multiple sugar transport system permease protein